MSSRSSRSGSARAVRMAAARRKPKRARSAATRSDRAQMELHTLQEFRKVFGAARRHDADVRRLAGISGSQLWALAEIARSAGMRVNDLSERMAVHQTTASNLLYALVERKLIRRVRDVQDQRVVRLHATMDGKRVLVRAPGPYTGRLVDALRHLDTSDLRRLKSALRALTDVIRDVAAGAAGDPLMGE
jgi:MarR family transcriptional regulator, organic hydroperoxide resistance regulator